MEKTMKITPPEGYEIDKEKSTFEQIVFKKKEPEFEHFSFNSAWVSSYSKIVVARTNSKNVIYAPERGNEWIDREHAQASMAMAQLSIRMESPTYNGDWKADFSKENTELNYCIVFLNDEIQIIISSRTRYFLAFKTVEKAEKFLKNFRDLIEEAKPLL